MDLPDGNGGPADSRLAGRRVIAEGTVLLLVMTDGRRDCIEQTIPSALDNLLGQTGGRIIYDDSGDDSYRWWLAERFGPDGFEVIHHPAGRQGFGGAIRAAWRHVALRHESFVFHLEDDFVFNRPVPLGSMMEIMEAAPRLAQLALRRQPWNDNERAAGGIIEQHPDAYADRSCCQEHAWLEHRQFFTTNPSLYRRSLCLGGWPDADHSEGVFSHQLFEDPELRCGFWGARESGEWVTHIGHQRAGTGY